MKAFVLPAQGPDSSVPIQHEIRWVVGEVLAVDTALTPPKTPPAMQDAQRAQTGEDGTEMRSKVGLHSGRAPSRELERSGARGKL